MDICQEIGRNMHKYKTFKYGFIICDRKSKKKEKVLPFSCDLCCIQENLVSEKSSTVILNIHMEYA